MIDHLDFPYDLASWLAAQRFLTSSLDLLSRFVDADLRCELADPEQ